MRSRAAGNSIAPYEILATKVEACSVCSTSTLAPRHFFLVTTLDEWKLTLMKWLHLSFLLSDSCLINYFLPLAYMDTLLRPFLKILSVSDL